jgi:hypothetical protein
MPEKSGSKINIHQTQSEVQIFTKIPHCKGLSTVILIFIKAIQFEIEKVGRDV